MLRYTLGVVWRKKFGLSKQIENKRLVYYCWVVVQTWCLSKTSDIARGERGRERERKKGGVLSFYPWSTLSCSLLLLMTRQLLIILCTDKTVMGRRRWQLNSSFGFCSVEHYWIGCVTLVRPPSLSALPTFGLKFEWRSNRMYVPQ